jgi:phasin family protein
MSNETNTIHAAESFSGSFEQVQAKLFKGAGSAMNKTAEMVGGNLAALTKSGQIWAAGVQDLSQQVAASVQSTVQETTNAFKTLTAVKSLREVIEVQSGFARNALDKAMSESGRLAQTSLKLTEQTLAPVTERIRVAGETLRNAS